MPAEPAGQRAGETASRSPRLAAHAAAGFVSPPVTDRSPLSPEASAQLERFVRPSGRWARGGVELLVRLLRLMGHGGRQATASSVGHLAHALGIRRRVTEDNLRAAFPDWPAQRIHQVARAAYVNMAHAALDGMMASTLRDEEAQEMLLDGPGAAAFFEAARSGGGAILATAHFGSWELLGDLLLRRGVPISAVVRPLSGALNRRIVASRVRAGMHLIHPRGAIQSVIRALREGRVVAVLSDQSVPAEGGHFIPFFGRPASTAPTLSVAARRTGVPVFVGAARRVDHRIEFFCEQVPIRKTAHQREDVINHLTEVTAALEAFIRAQPEQWLWLHRRWKVLPPEALTEAS